MARQRTNRARSVFSNIGFITKENDPNAAKLLESLEPSLKKYHSRVRDSRFYLDAGAAISKSLRSSKLFESIDVSEMVKKTDLVVTLGGDGTILRASRYLLSSDAWKTNRLLGINAGRLGFLTFVSAKDAAKRIDEILNAKVEESSLENRSCLSVKIFSSAQKLKGEYHVLNDIALTRESLSRIVEFQVGIDGDFLSLYRADGLIVSSPTGSTAYNLAAGGSILEPFVGALQITPICPQSFSNRPIVLADHRKVSLEVLRASSEVILTLDGHTAVEIRKGDRVEVTRSKKSITFLLPPAMTSLHYFESLRQKLKWGLVTPASA